MESSKTSMSYRDWRSAVDEHLSAIHCITIEDAGFDEEYLIKHWNQAKPRLSLSNGTATNMISIR
jgi:hypothetical protein